MSIKTPEESILNLSKELLDKYGVDIPSGSLKINLNEDFGKEIKKWKKAFFKHLNIHIRKLRRKRMMRKIFMSRKKRKEIECAEFLRTSFMVLAATSIFKREVNVKINKKIVADFINSYNPEYFENK